MSDSFPNPFVKSPAKAEKKAIQLLEAARISYPAVSSSDVLCE
jgi:hypothetical protein